MHTSSHWFDHIGEDLAHVLRRRWARLILWIGDWTHGLLGRLGSQGPSDEAKIQWDDGEPEDKV